MIGERTMQLFFRYFACRRVRVAIAAAALVFVPRLETVPIIQLIADKGSDARVRRHRAALQGDL